MARDSSPPADAIIDEQIPVLDHGFVRLVDYMGGDNRVVQSARVSYGQGTKTVREDRGLINYLMRHAHTSPFEQVELTFHVKAPIFVIRQWFRHRTACLAGDSVLSFDLPGAAKRKQGGRQHHGVTIADIYRLWHEGTRHEIRKRKPLHLDRVDPAQTYSVPALAALVERRGESLRNLIRSGALASMRRPSADPRKPSLFVLGEAWHRYALQVPMARVPMRDRVARMQLRMCDEATGEIRHTHIKDVWQSGVKPVFRVELDNGYSLEMTKDHRCLTEAGWATLEQATDLVLRDDGGVTWNGNASAFAVNGVLAYHDRAWLQEKKEAGFSVQQMADEAGVSYHTVRKYLAKYALSFSPAERSRLSGLAQRGQRRERLVTRVLTPEHLAKIRAARSGPRSNFWKGGAASPRENIGRWTTQAAAKVHERCAFACVICRGKEKLHAHHVAPVWWKPELAREFENLASLCTPCHTRLHAANLEVEFHDAFHAGGELAEFWSTRSARPRPEAKRLPAPQKLLRTYAKVRSIAYVGEVMTYDLEVEGPYHNFVANGFIVHNSVNEISGRYSVLSDEFYMPTPDAVRAQSTLNKQVGEGALPPEVTEQTLVQLEESHRAAYATHTELLEAGVARELARSVLPVGLYSEFYFKQNLHNLFHFLRLRLDWHAQAEIRAYATVMADMARRVAPLCYEAFEDHVLNARRFSVAEREALKRLLAGEPHGLDARAASEFEAKLL